MIKISDEQKNQRNAEQALSGDRGPYWRRAYRDWRLLMIAFFLTVGAVTYLLTGDLAWMPHGRWHLTAEKSDKHGTDLPPVTHDP
jgi:hypothetical protein